MIIYKTTNKVNNKFYIGKDQKNNPKYLGSGIELRRAIKKYGEENFIKEILEHCESKEQLAERERYWILQYNAVADPNSYNIHEGGHGGNTGAYHKVGRSGSANAAYGKPRTTEQKIKQSIKIKEWLNTPDGIKQRERCRDFFKNNNPGKNKSDITRKRISESRKGQPASHYAKYTLTNPSGEKIELFTKDKLVSWCNETGHSLWTIERRLLSGAQPKSGSLVGWSATVSKVAWGDLQNPDAQ